MPKKRWWEDGIRFECRGSGKCCTSRGQYGYVYLTLKDRRRLARGLRLPTAVFTRRYCALTDGSWHLKRPHEDCAFLEGKKCTVYGARPEQCRTWPFWPENMGARTWSREIRTFCPGIGKGKLHSAAEIRAALKRDPVNPFTD